MSHDHDSITTGETKQTNDEQTNHFLPPRLSPYVALVLGAFALCFVALVGLNSVFVLYTGKTYGWGPDTQVSKNNTTNIQTYSTHTRARAHNYLLILVLLPTHLMRSDT